MRRLIDKEETMKMRKVFITIICILAVFMGTLSSAAAATAASAQGLTGAQAREKAWDMMWRMATVKWSPSKTVYFMHQSEQIDGKTYTAGTNYVGMPYTASMKSLELFVRSFQDPDGDGIYDQFQPWVPVQYESMGDENIDTIDILMGNDCSGAIYWALSTVTDVDFIVTRDMMPANGSGLKFLTDEGDTVIDETTGQTLLDTSAQNYSRAIIMGKDSSTYPEREAAVKALMFKWYDSLQKGDVLAGTHEAGYNGAKYVYGHTMMVESVDPVNRTVTVLQHGGPGAEWKKTSAFTANFSGKKSELDTDNITTSTSNILWNYGEMSYEDLFELFYLPMTLDVYSTGAEDSGEVSIDNKNTGKLYLASGTVTSTRSRLQSVTVEISNEDGTLLDSVTLDTAIYRWKLFNNSKTERLLEYSFDMTNFAPYLVRMGMKAGETYRYKLSAHLADGNDYTLKEFMFVY